VNRGGGSPVSIDAVIEMVTRNPDGTATLHLGPRGGEGPGQPGMTVLNPPPGLEAAVGTEVWGNDSWLMVGETRWAQRVGYTACRLVGATGRRA
jgi:hypothetical protein